MKKGLTLVAIATLMSANVYAGGLAVLAAAAIPATIIGGSSYSSIYTTMEGRSGRFQVKKEVLVAAKTKAMGLEMDPGLVNDPVIQAAVSEITESIHSNGDEVSQDQIIEFLQTVELE